VRHVRMLGLCLVAVFAVCAMAAASAFAKEPKTNFGQFKNCPTKGSAVGKPVIKCTFGETTSGAGGSYTVGGITVNITKSIKLQGGYTAPLGETHQEVVEKHRTGILLPPEDGAPPIVPVAETVPGGVLGNVSEAEMEEFGWPQGLRESYKRAQKAHLFKEGKTTEVIEPAGLDPDFVSEYNILSESSEAEGGGPGIVANVQIKGKNPWLEYLGGNCLIGSEADPIVQELWTGEIESPLTHETMKGTAGFASLWHQAEIADLTGVELVADSYAVPAATKCGGPAYEAYLDPAVSRAFGLPAPAGASTTRLIGELDVSTVGSVSNHGL
jgi:hypothetical protein